MSANKSLIFFFWFIFYLVYYIIFLFYLSGMNIYLQLCFTELH